ncbi:NADP-dependent fatty aldehyde dehydrogenase [Aquimixticola soesokkakensis]|uniref:NADP-dependent fatty aldehyde dehydrogenase n=1 Tax=Aquimixticola soesokkakensis TaxID=1519096 RepID=A0A1Y5TBS2_9RHOB|nr:aldehyde dehydrogenase (NADP(+)) [Aquimixticola soesokkakensis]SLN60059.1 NADP-dependent fatty aldehyde dehydrogenase [Aquimixticola soesokkakensis]
MTYEFHGQHLIAGTRTAGQTRFETALLDGTTRSTQAGTRDLVDAAVQAAEGAFDAFAATTREDRARLLETIAEEIDACGDDITAFATVETGLPAARLTGERGRTTGQLRLFASHIRDGAYLDRRFDPALPDRAPLPRPDLRMMQRPIGPVAVFGASNFPLAFSVAGGDTASALAAGCPVVVKGHEAHPATGEIVAEAITAAIAKCGLPAGIFSFVQGGSIEVGSALVQHPLITAVGFTGSLGAGRALFDLCAARPTPIPFFGELGSVNPMFLLPQAVKARGAQIGAGWANSLTMGVGQFCTNPGIAVVLADQAQTVIEAARGALEPVGAQVMLSEGIAQSYRKGVETIAKGTGVHAALTTSCTAREAAPNLFVVCAADWLADADLAHEVFGPLGLLITVESIDEMVALARSFEGQLTTTLHMDDGDTALAQRLLPVLERKAGRLMVNGFPTGVEVADTMVHGGPYPASTNFGATSVGTMAIRRFLRPVCYQNLPAALLPEDLR